MLSSNEGFWHYNWPTKEMRYDHGEGQANNFCQCAGLQTASHCNLIFSPQDMWVHFPDLKKCCRACTAEQGCSILKPDWISGGNYSYGGRFKLGMDVELCDTWSEPGAVATDIWSSTVEGGLPCQYREYFSEFRALHILNMYTSKYEDSVEKGVFDVPSYCTEDCPRHGSQCG